MLDLQHHFALARRAAAGVQPFGHGVESRQVAPEMAGDVVFYGNGDAFGVAGLAQGLAILAARRKRAAGADLRAPQDALQPQAAARRLADIGNGADQAARIGMARRGKQRGRRRRLHDASRIHDDDAVGDLRQQVEIVGDIEHRQPDPALEHRQKPDDLPLRRHVEAGGRFV